MRTLWITAVVLGTVAGAATSVLAQANDDTDQAPLPAHVIPLAQDTIQPPSLTVADADARQAELETWMNDFSEWKKWADQWGNRREPGWFSEYRQRRQRPDPPIWLFDRCGDSLDETGTLADACRLLAEWRADWATAQLANSRAASTSGEEEGDKTIWWEHLHIDVAWPALQSGASLLGVIGMHATTSVSGRLEIFVAPGAMLLNVPARDGRRAWKLATNYGIAYRLGEFRFPGNRQALLHVNLAKAWLFSAGADVPTQSTDFVGFSVTFKKTP